MHVMEIVNGCPMWEQHHSVLGKDDDHPDAIKAREEEEEDK